MTLDLVPALAVGAFLTAAILPRVLQPLLVRAGMMDIPNERSSHSSPAIRGVGLAPAASLILALLILQGLGGIDRQLVLAGACTAIFGASLVGWIEDAHGIPSKHRALLQGFVGACSTSIILAGMDKSFWWMPLGALIIAVYINVANFMDGINGISGGHGLLVGFYYFIVGSLSHIEILTVIGILLTAVFAAFLPWNLIHGKMFLGDVGSYFLGSTTAVLSVLALLQGVHPIVVLGPVAINLTDTGFTLLRRIRNGDKWMEAHRSHVYQKLTDELDSHIKAAILVCTLGVAASGAGLLGLVSPVVGLALGLPLILALCWLYLCLPQIIRAYQPRSATEIR